MCSGISRSSQSLIWTAATIVGVSAITCLIIGILAQTSTISLFSGDGPVFIGLGIALLVAPPLALCRIACHCLENPF